MLRAWLTCLLLAAFSGIAEAQIAFEGGSGYDPWAVPATIAEVEALCQQAGVGAEGMGAARALVEGCEATLRRDELRAQRAFERAWIVRAREEQGAIQLEVQKAMEARTAAHAAASRALLADLRAILPKDSDEAWAAFERRRHRRVYLHQSWRVGVGVDLIEIARGQKVDTAPGVAEVLKSYEVDLDRRLLARAPLMAEYEQKVQKAETDAAPAEKAYLAVRDADCEILHLQRATAQKLISAAPEDKRGELRDRLLTARCEYVSTRTPLRERAEKLAKSGRLDHDKKRTLEEGIRAFDEKSRTIDEKHLTSAEDNECTRTYQQSVDGDPGDMAWFEDSRKVQAELLAVLERVATDEDLDAVSVP